MSALVRTAALAAWVVTLAAPAGAAQFGAGVDRQLLSTILFEDMPPIIAGTEISLPATGNPAQVPGALSFVLQPGENVFLFARLI